MRISTTQRIILITLVVFLIAFVTLSVNYKNKIWSVVGQQSFQLAQMKWTEGEKQEAIEFWLYGINRTVRDSINRERAYSLMRRADRFIEEGKSTEALDNCHAAEIIYNEEGEITYHCLMIEKRISETITPVP